MNSTSFARFGGLLAILAGLSGFLYSLAFIVISRSNPELGSLLSALFLMLGGLFATAVFVALHGRLQSINSGFAMWALLLGLFGAAGSVIHGAYDLANALHPPDNLANLPNDVDPRGILTFGLTGIAILIFVWLSSQSNTLPGGLRYVGYALGIALVVLYLARLIILDATHPVIVIFALLAGFVLNPIWNIWLGTVFRRADSPQM
jgi:hypothetical protein